MLKNNKIQGQNIALGSFLAGKRPPKEVKLAGFRKHLFCETHIFDHGNFFLARLLCFLNHMLLAWTFWVFFYRFHKIKELMDQLELIQPEYLPSRLKWERLFQFLPPWPQASNTRGRTPVDRNALLKALILQRLTRIRFLRDLHTILLESPPILAACGFNPYQKPPSLERFSAFLADTDHSYLEQVRNQLTQSLLLPGAIEAQHLGLDSCPVESWVRENNPKTSVSKDRFDKTKLPKGDPEARLGARVHFHQPGKRRVVYFWGYRNHVLADLNSELPLMELTAPNSVGELSVAQGLLEKAVSTFDLKIISVSADAEYDSEKLLRYIIKTLKAQAFIPRNPGNTQDKSGFQRKAQHVFCPGNLKMYRKGKSTTKGITYVQYCCPFYYGKKPDFLLCPASHPKFNIQKGCNYLWRVTDNIRDEIPYGTQYFKNHYNQRSAIERVFSRLLSLTLQEPSVRGLKSVQNHCTISHIAVLLVAKAAHELGHNNKIRFVRTFVPNFLLQHG